MQMRKSRCKSVGTEKQIQKSRYRRVDTENTDVRRYG